MRNYLSYSISILFFLISFLIISCGSPQKEIGDSYKKDIEGFWLRTGTIQYVNGVAVDTIKFVNTEDNKNYRQIKSYSKGGHVVWLNNWTDTINNPWSGGMGGYGKYKVHSKDSLSEYMSHGTGWFGAFLNNYKDSLKVNFETYNFSSNVTKNTYSQIMQANEENDGDSRAAAAGEYFAEFFEKLEPAGPKTRFDGVWKRVYEIQYINGIAVDTTNVSSDVVLDVKAMYQGRFLYQVDFTKITDPNSPEHGGGGGYGQFEYDPKTGVLNEMTEVGSGNWGNDSFFAPRSNKLFHDITFYNDDLFLQIGKDTLNQGQIDKETGQKRLRGLVYERID